jgi:glycosyltransferase involved in cell wall biosynthesis
MRILWHSAHPDMPTGYGGQTALLLPRFRTMGHEVAVSATAGQPNHPGFWNGIPVYPCTTYADVGEDVVAHHYHRHKADIVFTFLCTWLLQNYPAWHDLRTVHLTPVDCEPMSHADAEVIEKTGGTPAAISQFGLDQMRSGGHPGNKRPVFDPLYLPHGVDTSVFTPAPDREAMRADMGYAGKFVVGMNFMNNDRTRKNIYPALRAFAAFRQTHPDAVLAVHALAALPDGLHLARVAAHLGLHGAVSFSPQYELVTGMIRPDQLADWYRPLDVLLNIGNEGFGLPAIEAQACGVPVILGDWTTGPQLAGPGWLVSGSEPDWNEKHRADWRRAHIAPVMACLDEAYEDARNRREASRDNALMWDINRVVRDYWEPVLGDLG